MDERELKESYINATKAYLEQGESLPDDLEVIIGALEEEYTDAITMKVGFDEKDPAEQVQFAEKCAEELKQKVLKKISELQINRPIGEKDDYQTVEKSFR